MHIHKYEEPKEIMRNTNPVLSRIPDVRDNLGACVQLIKKKGMLARFMYIIHYKFSLHKRQAKCSLA